MNVTILALDVLYFIQNVTTIMTYNKILSLIKNLCKFMLCQLLWLLHFNIESIWRGLRQFQQCVSGLIIRQLLRMLQAKTFQFAFVQNVITTKCISALVCHGCYDVTIGCIEESKIIPTV